MNTLGDRISYLVSETGLTKTAFAERIGLSQSYVSGICTNVKIPSDRTIADICRVFRVSEQWLRTGEGPMYVEQSRAEKIAAFLSDIMADTPESIRAVVVSSLADLDLEDWQAIERIYRKCIEGRKKP